MELHDYKLPNSKASWGSKTESERNQRGAPGSYDLPLSGNLESHNEFDIKFTHIVSLYNCNFLWNFFFELS